MEIGFLTNCFRKRNLPDIIQWAGANGFQTLELACVPHDPNTVDPSLDVENFNQARADTLNALAKSNNLSYSCLTFCDNMLARDLDKQQRNLIHIRRVIDAAQLLGVKTVCTFIGRNETLTQAQNFKEMERVFGALLEYAQERGIRIAIENYPALGDPFEGLPGNLAYAPLIWDELFSRLPNANFGLNLDPSHLVWLGVDYMAAAKKFGPRLFHTHAKDTAIFAEKRAYNSILNSGGGTWWEYRIPGRGEIDWKEWLATLKASGYDGAVCIEHEDPEYEKTEALLEEGLLLGKKNLEEALTTL